MTAMQPYESGNSENGLARDRIKTLPNACTYFMIAGATGLVWYLCLSLPISPLTYWFLVEHNHWPDPVIASSMALASIASAWALRSVIAYSSSRLAVVVGVAHTLFAASLCTLFLFASCLLGSIGLGTRSYPLYGGSVGIDVFVEAAYVWGYAMFITAISGPVAFPVGVAGVFALRVYGTRRGLP